MITYIFNPFTSQFDAIETTSGTPNTFAGYDATGELYTIPGWVINQDGGNSTQLYLAPANVLTPNSNRTLHNFQNTVTPSSDLTNLSFTNMQNYLYMNGPQDFSNMTVLSTGLNYSGGGAALSITGWAQSLLLGDAVNPTSSVGISGSYSSINISPTHTDTGSIFGQLTSIDVNAGATITYFNGVQNIFNMGAGSSANSLVLQAPSAAIAGAVSNGASMLESSIAVSATGSVAGQLSSINSGMSVATGGSVGYINGIRSYVDVGGASGQVTALTSDATLSAGAAVTGAVTLVRSVVSADATASHQDVTILDLGLNTDATVTSGNLRLAALVGNVTSDLPSGSGLLGMNIGYTASGTADFVNGIGMGNNLQSGAVIASTVQGLTENTHMYSGSSAPSMSSIAIGSTVDVGATLTGGYQGINIATGLHGTMSAANNVGVQTNMQISSAHNSFQGILDTTTFQSGAAVTSSIESIKAAPQMQAGSSADSLTMLGGYAGVDAAASLNQLSGLRIGSNINATVPSVYLASLSAYGSGSATQLTGLEINLSSMDSPAQKLGLDINDGAIRQGTTMDTGVYAPTSFSAGNQFSTNLTVASGSPLASTALFGTSLASGMIFQDDMGPDGIGGLIGFTSLANVGYVSVASGKTADTVQFSLAGANVPSVPGDGGTITNVSMYTAGGIFPGGGALTIDNIYGFKVPSAFTSMSPTNAWGLYVEDSNAENFMAKSLAISTASKKVSAPGIGLEIEAKDALLSDGGALQMGGATSGTFTQSAAATTSSYSVKWPSAQGAAADVLTNDGAGNLSWAPAGSGGGPSTFTLANNQTTFADVTGFYVDPTLHRAFTAETSTVRENTPIYVIADTEDTAFYANTGSAFDGITDSVARQPDGKYLVGGSFANFDGNGVLKFARLNADGSEDTAFNANLGTGFGGGGSGFNTVFAIAVQTDGKILVGGDIGSLNGNIRRRIVRLNSDGTEDTAFYANYDTAGGFNSYVSSIGIQSNGNIVVSGAFTALNGVTANYAVVLNSDGTLNTAISGLNNGALALAIQSDDYIVFGGTFSAPANGLARYTDTYSPDTTFNTNLGIGFDSTVYAIAIQADGKIVVGGNFTDLNANTRNYIARLNSDGTDDSAFYANLGSGFNLTVRGLAMQGTNILVGGDFSLLNGNSRNFFARIDSTGTDDSAFYSTMGTAFNNSLKAFAVDPVTTQFVVVGNFTSFNGNTRNRIIRYQTYTFTYQDFVSQDTIKGVYHTSTGTWSISSAVSLGDAAGVTLQMTDLGQMQYKTTNLTGTVVVSEFKFQIVSL